jgi:integrase
MARGCAAAGIAKGEPVTFHCLRHTRITALTEAGLDPALTKLLVGHAIGGVTEVYTHRGADWIASQLEEAVGKEDWGIAGRPEAGVAPLRARRA